MQCSAAILADLLGCPVDLVLGGGTTPERAADVIGPLAEAGVTWWEERLPYGPTLESAPATLNRIEQGPPQLTGTTYLPAAPRAGTPASESCRIVDGNPSRVGQRRFGGRSSLGRVHHQYAGEWRRAALAGRCLRL